MDWLKKLGKVYRTDKNDIYIKTDAKNIAAAIKTLKEKKIGHITAITGIDTKKEIEIIYHFWTGKQMINIKTAIDRNLPKIKTITKDFPGAMLYEM
ncbi:MAG: NADH-quinone oxidoreductase subunit C, partial [Candidatus Aenigmarchaeota archaeon]|nr:NADH-quinone oxidoreductase subunit C [Candidatus Aenigmarchaeota archaeon]